MEPRLELLWRMYDDHQQMARHHDEQRSTLTQYMLIIAAATVGVAKIGEISPVVNLLLSLFIIVLGVIGITLMRRHSHDCMQQDSCANRYRNEMEKLCPDIRIPAPETTKYTDSAPWTYLHALVILLGVTLLICVFLHPDSGSSKPQPSGQTPVSTH